MKLRRLVGGTMREWVRESRENAVRRECEAIEKAAGLPPGAVYRWTKRGPWTLFVFKAKSRRAPRGGDIQGLLFQIGSAGEVVPNPNAIVEEREPVPERASDRPKTQAPAVAARASDIPKTQASAVPAETPLVRQEEQRSLFAQPDVAGAAGPEEAPAGDASPRITRLKWGTPVRIGSGLHAGRAGRVESVTDWHGDEPRYRVETVQGSYAQDVPHSHLTVLEKLPEESVAMDPVVMGQHMHPAEVVHALTRLAHFVRRQKAPADYGRPPDYTVGYSEATQAAIQEAGHLVRALRNWWYSHPNPTEASAEMRKMGMSPEVFERLQGFFRRRTFAPDW